MEKKRDLFAELTEGFAALAGQRVGKRTLRTHTLTATPAPRMTPRELAKVSLRGPLLTRARDALSAVARRVGARRTEHRRELGVEARSAEDLHVRVEETV